MTERFKYKVKCRQCKKWFIPKTNNNRKYCYLCVPDGEDAEE